VSVHQTITVVVPGGAPPTTAPVSVAGTTIAVGPQTGTLPRTGDPLLPLLLWVAVVLILAGRLLLGVARHLARQDPSGVQQVDRS
jgi:hypothetical protein